VVLVHYGNFVISALELISPADLQLAICTSE